MRLIDADEFKRIAAGCVFETPKGLRIKAEIAIDARPAVDAKPVRHGRWIVHTTWNGMFGLIHSECSECKFDRNGDLSSWNFCPHCGAIMDGGADNG